MVTYLVLVRGVLDDAEQLRTVLELLACWTGPFGKKEGLEIWMIIPVYLI